jgi:hypothetical protein
LLTGEPALGRAGEVDGASPQGGKNTRRIGRPALVSLPELEEGFLQHVGCVFLRAGLVSGKKQKARPELGNPRLPRRQVPGRGAGGVVGGMVLPHGKSMFALKSGVPGRFCFLKEIFCGKKCRLWDKSRHVAAFKLELVKPRVERRALQQFRVRSPVHHAALVHDDNLVGF